MKKVTFEEFAPEFNKVYKSLGYYYDSVNRDIYEDCPDDSKSQLEQYLNDKNVCDDKFVEDYGAWFETALETDKESLIKYLEKYYESADKLFEYWEFEHGGFGNGYQCFVLNRRDVLYLCSRYFEFIGDTSKKEKSILFALLPCAYSDADDSYNRKVFKLFESELSVVKKMIFADWQCVMPKLTHKIGRYYKEKRDYAKAYQYFKLGASLEEDYDGRQSAEPFACVGFNQYELGLIYYKGLGRKKNTKKALGFFELSAENLGLNDCMPVIGDIYFTGDGVKKDWGKAYECYIERNSYNEFSLDYTTLTDVQKGRLKKIINSTFDWENLTVNDLIELIPVYKNVLGESEKAEEFYGKLLELIDLIPLNERTEIMDKYSTKNRLDLLRKTLKKPTENTGYIPENLKIGDVFTFGCFNGEPLEWKAVEENDDGTVYVISTKVIAKMTYRRATGWLTGDFFNSSFTDEEKSHINNHNNVSVYLPSEDQLRKFEGKYDSSKNVETDFAKSLSATNVLVCYNACILTDSWIKHSEYTVGGIRPAMDVFISR